MSEQHSSSASARRIDALTRQLGATPLAKSTKEKVMAELASERARASFPVREMTYFLDGGAKMTKYREEMMSYLENAPELAATPGSYDLSLAQRREFTLNRVRRFYQLIMQHGTKLEKRNAMVELAGVYDLGMWVRNGVHFGLFVGAIMSQGDQAQQDEWLASAFTLEIFGSFAMTELGHGSYTRGLETTATFDRATDEFIIHTPTDTATKWWIGAAGETATHTVVYAQLMIDGESKGVQTFLVQLRDPQTHAPLPGIRIGDCGSKMGLQGIDNGWIQFDNVRVPRSRMLRRFASVTREGEFVQTHRPQMAYAALVGTRGRLVTISNGMLKRALTIAVRYSAIRRQGVSVGAGTDAAGTPEAKLLDYQSHQYRLMPLLALAYAYHFQASYVEGLIKQFETQGGDLAHDQLADIHGTMAGLKAFSTWDTLAGLETCRQSCGGAGYSSYNGLASLISDFSVMVTFEGDNTVMALQTASYAVRAADALRADARARVPGSLAYVARAHRGETARRWRVRAAADLADPAALREALDALAGAQVLAAARQHADALAALGGAQAAWNACHVELLEAARLHVFHSVATRFVAQVQALQADADPARAALARPLALLCELYVLHELDRSGAALLRAEFATPAQSALVRARVAALCALVRADAVPLVDAFNMRDVMLNSSIGRADGNVYEDILSVATGKTGVSPYFATAIKPMLEGEQLE